MWQARELDLLQALPALAADLVFAALDRDAKRAVRLCSRASKLYIDSLLATVEFSTVGSFQPAVAARTPLRPKNMLLRYATDELAPSPSMRNLARGVMTLTLRNSMVTNAAHLVSSGPGG